MSNCPKNVTLQIDCNKNVDTGRTSHIFANRCLFRYGSVQRFLCNSNPPELGEWIVPNEIIWPDLQVKHRGCKDSLLLKNDRIAMLERLR